MLMTIITVIVMIVAQAMAGVDVSVFRQFSGSSLLVFVQVIVGKREGAPLFATP